MTDRVNSRGRRLAAAGAIVSAIAAGTLAILLWYQPAQAWLRSRGTEPLNGKDVGMQEWHAAFSLTDASGRRRTLSDFAGKVVLVAFGYTRCPDACPTTLARFARVQRMLGEDSGHVRILFVTIDPERDTAELLDRYVRAFDPAFIALRGSEDETDVAATAFHADYRFMHHGKDILVEHTVDAYLVDSHGRVRSVLPYNLGPRAVALDVQTVLREDGLCQPCVALVPVRDDALAAGSPGAL